MMKNKGWQIAAKSAGIGMAVGAAAGLAGTLAANSRKHAMKRRAKHAAGVVGDMLDSVSMIFR